MLTMLGGLAEFERELIQASTGEGRKRAMAKGVKFGRPRKLNPHQRQEALKRVAAGETYTAIARSTRDPNTIAAWTKWRLTWGGPLARVVLPNLVGAGRLLRRQPLHIQPRPPSLRDDVEGNAVLALEFGRDA